MDAATHSVRVPFQRRHASAGRHVPDLERLVHRRRHEAPPVRKRSNAMDLRQSHIITKVQWTPQRTLEMCPSSVARHLPVVTSQTLSVLSSDADTTRSRCGCTATLVTCNGDTSSQKYSGRRNARSPSALSASVRRIRIYGIQNNALTCSSSTCRASLWRRLPARRVHRLCHCCRLWIDYSSCPLSLSIRYRHVTRHGSCSFGQPSGQSYLGSRWSVQVSLPKSCWSCGARRPARPPAIIDTFHWPHYHFNSDLGD